MWLGNKPRTIIVVAVSLAVFGAILTLYHAFESVDPEKIKLIQTLNGTKMHIVTKVLLPSTVLVFINNMKVNIGLCLVGVIIGEFLAENLTLFKRNFYIIYHYVLLIADAKFFRLKISSFTHIKFLLLCRSFFISANHNPKYNRCTENCGNCADTKLCRCHHRSCQQVTK